MEFRNWEKGNNYLWLIFVFNLITMFFSVENTRSLSLVFSQGFFLDKFIYLFSSFVIICVSNYFLSKILKIEKNFIPIFLCGLTSFILFSPEDEKRLFVISLSMLFFSLTLLHLDYKRWRSYICFFFCVILNGYMALMIIPFAFVKKLKLVFVSLSSFFLAYLAYKAELYKTIDLYYFDDFNKYFYFVKNYSLAVFLGSIGAFLDSFYKQDFYMLSFKNAAFKLFLSFLLLSFLCFVIQNNKEKKKTTLDKKSFQILLFLPLTLCLSYFLDRSNYIIYISMLPLLVYVMENKIACKMCGFGFVFWFCLICFIAPYDSFYFLPAKMISSLPTYGLFISLMWISAMNWRKNKFINSEKT